MAHRHLSPQSQPQKRNTRSIAPLSIAPDQTWLGNDGPWSPFLLGYGTPAQFVKSFIATSIPQPYVVIPGGCIATDPSNCSSIRGNLWLSNQSSTWQSLGNYALEVEENLGFFDAGDFGFDTITLGLPGSNAPSMQHQIVIGIETTDFFLATWGLRPAPTNFTNFNNPVPSLLENLKQENKTSSISWGYTAGSYQIGQLNKDGLRSLTIGGYDASRLEANNVTFSFAADISRGLVVAVVAISTSDGSDSLLSSPVLSFLDSAVSHIWLPEDSCQRFEENFNLTYDENLDLYLVNDTVHQNLPRQNTSISFTLSNDLTISSSSTPITIDLPYSAFDLQLTPEYPNNTQNATYYFPIRKASNESQYTLGRAFFQHAYIIADYERSAFSVYQAVFPSGDTQQNLIPILPVSSGNGSNTTSGASSGNGSGKALSAGELAGIIVAVIIVTFGLLGAGVWIYRNWKAGAHKKHSSQLAEDVARAEMDDEGRSKSGVSEVLGRNLPTPELADGLGQQPELPASETARELPSWPVGAELPHGKPFDRNPPQRWEMPG